MMHTTLTKEFTAADASAAENQETIGRLTGALRTLEERQRAGLMPRPEVRFFLAGLDRTLTVERAYTAMVFGAGKEHRDELTNILEERLATGRGGIITSTTCGHRCSPKPPAWPERGITARSAPRQEPFVRSSVASQGAFRR